MFRFNFFNDLLQPDDSGDEDHAISSRCMNTLVVHCILLKPGPWINGSASADVFSGSRVDELLDRVILTGPSLYHFVSLQETE